MNVTFKYRHGNETVEKELYKLQIFNEGISDVLLGTDKEGDDGMVEDWKTHKIEGRAFRRLAMILLTAMAAIGGIPSLIVILQLMHVIPK